MVEAVKRGVLAAGALPVEFPTVSLGEVYLNPTSLVFRNLMSIDTEEMVRAQPMDSVVLVGGCDKTVPAQLMGAASADKPAIQLVGGPMMTSRYGDERLGACTDCRRYWARYRAGELTPVFFGSAINNFGVEELLDSFIEYAPPPLPRETTSRVVDPTEERFSGFVFKIQANMDPQHRDRIAFLRVCSGSYGNPVMSAASGVSATRSPRLIACTSS